MAIVTEYIINELQGKFGNGLSRFEQPYQLLTFTATRENIMQVLEYLYTHQDFQMQFLTDLCAVHYPDDKQIVVVYHVHSLIHNFRVRIKVILPEDKPVIATATKLFSAANWMERETYDFFGVKFEGHPNLKRILNVDDMVAFPMRKEYPLEDPNRIDKNDSYFGR